MTLSHLFLKLSSPILPILSSSRQNGCESGSLVWDGSWHGFRFHPSATYNHPQCVRQWPMEASEDRGLELGAHHETVTVLFFFKIISISLRISFPAPAAAPAAALLSGVGAPKSLRRPGGADRRGRQRACGCATARATASVMPTLCPEPAALEAPWETKSTDGPAGDTAMPQTAPSSAPGA